MIKEPFSVLKPAPVCAGTGLLALDIVFNGNPDMPPKLWAGGSCGNVLTILSYLGWQSYPVARLGNDDAAVKIKEDMNHFNVRFDFVENDKRVNTPIIVERIRMSKDGRPTHRFFWVCPNCGKWLPRYRPILLSKAKQVFMEMPKFQCFYFDRVSPGAIELANSAREAGSLVIFEPPNIRENALFSKAANISHIVKYAYDRIGHYHEIAINNYPKLVIETLGSEGLRYKLIKNSRSSFEWKTLSSYRVYDFRDAAGSGDWCSAGIIHILGRLGSRHLENATEEEIIEVLQFGQALASFNCRFEGARGGMYSMEKESFATSIKSIMASHELPEPILEEVSNEASDIIACICPGCQNKKESSEP